MQVLLIEPDIVLADLYTRALNKAGCHVRRTSDAQLAIHAVDEHLPDVVVLELQLVRHNGVEFLYEFRSYPEWSDVPVIIASAVPKPQLDPKIWAQLGVAAYHYKPEMKLEHLCRSVMRLAGAAAEPGSG